MDEPTAPLSELGELLARAQDDAREGAVAERAGAGRARLLASLSRRRRVRQTAVIGGAALAGALAAGLVAAVLRGDAGGGAPAGDVPLAFVVGDGTTPGRAGDWVVAPAGGDAPLRFADGTELRLAAGATGRVVATEAAGATFALEDGEVTAAVVHRPGARWSVVAGPFEVHVTGTRFRVRWEADVQALSLTLEKGSVLLRGPLLGEGRAVTAGEVVTVSLPAHRLEVGALANDADALAAVPSASVTAAPEPARTMAPAHTPAPVGPGTAAGAGATTSAPASTSAAPSTEPPARDWKALFASHDYPGAFLAADRAGFTALCMEAPAEDLAALADVARYAGPRLRAVEAYETLRNRFPGDPAAAVAAYRLGSIHYDDPSGAALAAYWFGVYLAELPDGPLAREAAGRRIEALDRSGESDAARAAAVQYLRLYPHGPHAELARRLAAPAPSK
ncbi:MAG TPA: FecR domain-containing protein [Myxococcota bacterium]|nr:FecR domain-containing protein [Myxococcota bacterium]